MAIKDVGAGYKCSYCGKHYAKAMEADSCRDSHDLVYVTMKRSDLSRLIQFIYSGEKELLTVTMINDLRKFVKRITEDDYMPEVPRRSGMESGEEDGSH